jgi:SAM-dependent methyltransferase
MKFNRLCNIEDWSDPDLVVALRRVLPQFANGIPGYPSGCEHRKHWEFAHVMRGLEVLGAVTRDAWVLSVAGGHEAPAYYLTNFVRWVFLVDIYGVGGFSGIEAQPTVLTDPDAFAEGPYNRNRLVVQYMNALDLRFEPGTFDAVFCLSSLEHFGGVDAAVRAIREMHRVLKTGGVAAVTTECIINGEAPVDVPTLMLFTPALIQELATCVRGLELVEPIDFSVSPATRSVVHPLRQAVEDARAKQPDYPHLVIELLGRQFTSVALFFRKTID